MVGRSSALVRRGMMHRMRDQSGQALVEFAIILPLVLLILLGVVDFGLAFNTQNDEAHLANLAVRLADVNLCTQCNAADGNQQVVKYVAQQADTKQLANNGLTICFFNPAPGNPAVALNRGDPIKVKISSNFEWFRYTGLNFGTTPIAATVTGRLEQPYNNGAGDIYALNMKYNTANGAVSNDPGCA
jgi:uncharacterized protein (UPF0333 family)